MKYKIEITEDAKEDLSFFKAYEKKEILVAIKEEEEFILSRADDFEAEVEAFRNSPSFQAFLDKRMECKIRFPIEEIEKEIEEELKAEVEKKALT